MVNVCVYAWLWVHTCICVCVCVQRIVYYNTNIRLHVVANGFHSAAHSTYKGAEIPSPTSGLQCQSLRTDKNEQTNQRCVCVCVLFIN